MMTRFLLAFVLLLGFGYADAAHLRNVGSGFCATSSATQATCAATTAQDFYPEPMSGSQYRLRFGANCLTAATGAPYEVLTMAACSSAAGQLWTVMLDAQTPSSRSYKNALISGTQGDGNCLGIGEAAPGSSGSALTLDYCVSEFREWSTKLAYARSQSGASTTPVFAITSGALGARVPGSTVATGTLADCDAFSKGAYCALASDTTKAILARPTSGRPLASLAALIYSTWPVSTTPTPASMAALDRAGSLTHTVRIDATSNSVISGKRIRPTSPTDTACIYIAPSVHDVTIQDNDIGECRYGVFAPSAGNNIVVQRNVIHGVASGMYTPSPSGAIGNVIYTRNFVHTIDNRGAGYDGAAFQAADIALGAGQSKITCNVIHGRYKTGANTTYTPFSLDKVNLGGAYPGTSSQKLLLQYNRILGMWTGGQDSGSGFQIGDTPATPNAFKYIDINHNTIIFVNGGGITISGGDNVTIDSNIVDSRGESAPTKTGVSFNWSNYYPSTGSCVDLTVTNNRGNSRIWYYHTFTGNVTAGSAIITGISAVPSDVVAGTLVSGTGFASPTSVLSKTSTTITLSANATATATGQTFNYGALYGAANDGNCSPKTVTGNNFGDTTLRGEAEFETPYSACEP